MAGFEFGEDPLVNIAKWGSDKASKAWGAEKKRAGVHNEHMNAALSYAQQRSHDSLHTMAENEHAHGLAMKSSAQTHRQNMAKAKFEAGEKAKDWEQINTNAGPGSKVTHSTQSSAGNSSSVSYSTAKPPKANAGSSRAKNPAAAAAAATSSKTTKI